MTNRFAVETAIYRVSPTVKMILTDHYKATVYTQVEKSSIDHFSFPCSAWEWLIGGSASSQN
ncbi:hypothetical protein F8S20_30860 [Nostoc sp. BAE]|nr:hypothetical protein [Nostoc commune BAE]